MRIVTSRDLVQHHQARAALYAACARWFEGGAVVDAVPVEPPEPAPPLHWDGPPSEAVLALLQAQAAQGTARALRVLAFLSREASHALGEEDLSGAAALLSAERSYRDQHGARVLTQTCVQLAGIDEPIARALCARLADVIADDRAVPVTTHGSPIRNDTAP